MAVRLYGYIPLMVAAAKYYEGLLKTSANAAMRAGVAPFIDASCVEEPSLSSSFPAVTSVCRPGKGIGRWKPGDIIIYWTNGWLRHGGRSHCKAIPAVLSVRKVEPSHRQAGMFYKNQALVSPSNISDPCLTPVSLSRCAVDGVKWRNRRMRVYRNRVSTHTHVALCNRCYVDVCNPVWISKAEILKIFIEVPGTQNGVQLNADQERLFRAHMTSAGVTLPC